jgi:hypothetical protein
VERVWPPGKWKWLHRWGTANSPAANAVAVRVALPAPSATLGRRRPGPRGLPGSSLSTGERVAHATRPCQPMAALVAFHLSFRGLTLSAGTPRGFRRSHELLLSWDSPATPPLCRSTTRASTPGGRGLLRIDGAIRRLLVPPSWFPTTSAVFSAPGLRVCCTPLPALGFDAFPAPGAQDHPKVPWETITFPASRLIPFEEFPSSAAVPHHCGHCPPAVAARSPRPDPLGWRRAWRLSTSGRSHRFEAGYRTDRRPKPPSEPRGARRASIGRSRRWRPPRWCGEVGEPMLCSGDAPIRRSGPPRHHAGSRVAR